MDNFPSNSHTAKQKPPNYTGKSVQKVADEQPKPKKVVEKVVTGEVVMKKKSVGRKFKDTFFGREAASVGEFVIVDVVIPALKDLVADAVTQGVERRLFGDSRSARRSAYRPDPANNRAGHVSYDKFSRPGGSRDRREREERPSRRRGVNLDEIYLASRVEADEVLERMYDLLERYEAVSVSDLNDMLGVSSDDFTNENIGWTSLAGSRVQRTSRGYLVDLPRPEAL